MEPDPSGRGHVVDLAEDLRHVRRISRSGPIERQRRRIELVERVRNPVSFGLEAHRGPLLVNRGLEVVDERGPNGDRLGFLPLSITEQRRRRAGFLGNRGLGVIELFPHHDDRKGQKHGIDDAHGREFETGDLVVLGQCLDADPAADQDLGDHRQEGGNNHHHYDQEPQRDAGEEMRHYWPPIPSDIRGYPVPKGIAATACARRAWGRRTLDPREILLNQDTFWHDSRCGK